jgi:transposase
MDEWTEIRRKVLVGGASKRSIHRDYGIGHEALAKILANAEPPGYQMAEIRRKPVIGPHLATIEAILAEDREAPPKQRHTARRIFERLRDEHGYGGCYSQVQTAVMRATQYSKEAFVPLSHPPGHAQFDFGEAVVEIDGVRRKAALGVITLPYSDTYFLSAYPRECTETFQAAHVAAFEFFGGVPIRTSYDNTTIAVSKVTGRERVLTRAFLALESHYLFDHHFCRVGRGNEKGHVENHVGYARRNLLVPVPSFPSWSALNEYLAAACYADLFRRVRGKVGTKAERLSDDRAALLALPTEAFEPRRVAQGHANSLSLVRFDRNDCDDPLVLPRAA